MLATMGYVTPEITRKLTGYLSPSAGLKFADVLNGLAAINKQEHDLMEVALVMTLIQQLPGGTKQWPCLVLCEASHLHVVHPGNLLVLCGRNMDMCFFDCKSLCTIMHASVLD